MNCATNRDRLNHRVKSRASWKCVLKKLCFSFEFHIISSEQIIILASMECLPRWQCAWGWQTDLSHDMKITSETLKSWWLWEWTVCCSLCVSSWHSQHMEIHGFYTSQGLYSFGQVKVSYGSSVLSWRHTYGLYCFWEYGRLTLQLEGKTPFCCSWPWVL